MEQKTIFSAVLNRLLEAFAPTLNQAITLFENSYGKNQTEVIQQIFYTFPRYSAAYKHMISSLVQVASCDPSLILNYIAEMFEEIRKSSISSAFTNLRGMSPMYKQDNKYHKQLFLNFMHLFIADLTCVLLQKYGSQYDGCLSIIDCGFKLCLETSNKQSMIRFLHPLILKQWSAIFSLISTNYGLEIMKQFKSTLQVRTAKELFQLICYTRLDLTQKEHKAFLDYVLQILKQYHRDNILSVRILMSVSKLVSTSKESPAFEEMFKFISSLTNESSLKEGTFDLLASLFLRMGKNYESAMQSFYRKRVYAHAQDQSKVARSMRLFQRFMYGTSVDVQWLSWNWSIDPPRSSLCFIKWNSQPNVKQSNAASFSNYFMKYFFAKSDFMVCPDVFCNVIVHLASLDFDYFVSSIFPEFFKLELTDSRFIVFLKAVQLINSQDFLENCYQKDITQKKIQDFNLKLKPKILEALKTVKPDECADSISFFDLDPDMKMKMEAADQKINEILHDWGIDNFGPTATDYNESSDSPKEFTISIQLVRTLRSVLTPSDFAPKKMINMCLKLSFHQNRRIASAAIKICAGILTLPELQLKFVQSIVEYLQKPVSDECLFVCLTMLLNVLNRNSATHGIISISPSTEYIQYLQVPTQNPSATATPQKSPKSSGAQPPSSTFKMSTYHDIELIAYLGLVSIHPSTRYLSYKLLIAVNDCLNERGSLTYIKKGMQTIESNVKQRILAKSFGNELETPLLPSSSVNFEVAVLSHYFDIWLMFVCEIANRLVSINYTPAIQRFQDKFKAFSNLIKEDERLQKPSSIGILILYLSTHAHIDYELFQELKTDDSNRYEPLQIRNDTREEGASIIKELLNCKDWSDQLALSVIQNVHFTLYPQILTILSQVKSTQIPDSTETAAIILRNPNITNTFMRSFASELFSFLGSIQSLFISYGINSPRLLEWTQEMENTCSKYTQIIKHFCCIVSYACSSVAGSLSEDVWSLSSREIVFRFLINWCMTVSSNLQVVRNYAQGALVSLVKVGQIFSDSLTINDEALALFSHMEQQGHSILSLLLFYHVEMLLDLYIQACYTHPQSNVDYFLESIFMAFDATRTDFLYKLTGQLMLLGLVLWQSGHPRAESFIRALIDIILVKRTKTTQKIIEEHLKEDDFREELPLDFSYANESLLEAALSIVILPNLTTPLKDIVEAIKPWCKTLRLLPNQDCCIPNTPSEFHRFTPYSFLDRLLDTTVKVGPDNFITFSILWSLIMNLPDHSDLIPLFISTCNDPQMKQQMFKYLITTDTTDILSKLATRLTFAYYFHITEYLKQDFNEELWIIPLLVTALQKSQDELIEFVPSIVHFAFLFCDVEGSVLETICKQFGVKMPDGAIDSDVIIALTKSLALKLKEESPESLQMWGEEALKWLFGSKSLKFAYYSLLIYNQLMVPNEELVLKGICRSVYYHMLNTDPDGPDSTLLSQFVGETFKYYTVNFVNNEVFCYQYASSFFDYAPFVSTCLPLATQLFVLSLTSPKVNQLSWNSIISIVRPLLVDLENNEASQKIFDFLIKSSNVEELKVIVLPIKESNPELFHSITIAENFLDTCSTTTLCKALLHYAMMIDTASTHLMNKIFKISSIIVNKIVNENNRPPLSKLYSTALGALTTCPDAVTFIVTISKREPGIACKSEFEFYDWARSTEAIIGSLKRLVDTNIQSISFTDCSSLSAVSSILFCDTPPKIQPFSSQREMIESMQKTRPNRRKMRSASIRGGFSTVNGFQLRVAPTFNDFSPIKSPKSVLKDNKMFSSKNSTGFVMSSKEFLKNY